MNQQARSVLAWAIENLEAGLLDNPMSLVNRADTLTQEESAALNILAEGHNEVFRRVSRAIYGNNILNPPLTNKGWKIWTNLPVTSSEKKALLSAISRYRDCVVSSTSGVAELESQGNFDYDGFKQALSAFAQIQMCITQFTAELKAVIG